MKILLNGQPRELAANSTLENLINTAIKDPAHTITEVNGTVIARISWAKITLHDGDKVELLSFVGGG